MSETRKLKIRCPACNADLIVDQATGSILSHRDKKVPPAGGKRLETLLEDLDKNKAEAEDLFNREMAAIEDHDRLLEEKFKEALKRAEESPEDEPPPRPFDLD